MSPGWDEVVVASVVAGAVLFAIGMLLYIVVPHIGRNPLIGARWSYSLRSKENWRATNRFAGIVFMVVGIVILALPYPLRLLRIVNLFPWFLLAIVLCAGFLSLRFSRNFYFEKERRKEKV